MAGLLRKKNKTAPPQQQPTTPDAPPTPLFSRFASKAQEPQRTVVSSPMVLSSQNRASRVISQPTPQRRPASAAIKSQEAVNNFGREPRARAKPLPLPFESPLPAASLPRRSNSPDITFGDEYAHLWNVIAGNDTNHHEAREISEQYNNAIHTDTTSATTRSSPHPTPQHVPPPNIPPPAQKIPAPVLPSSLPQPPPSFSSLKPDHDLSAQTFAPPFVNQPRTRHDPPADLHRPSPSELGDSRSSLTLISEKHTRGSRPADDHVVDSRPARPTNGVPSNSYASRVSIPSLSYLRAKNERSGFKPQSSDLLGIVRENLLSHGHAQKANRCPRNEHTDLLDAAVVYSLAFPFPPSFCLSIPSCIISSHSLIYFQTPGILQSRFSSESFHLAECTPKSNTDTCTTLLVSSAPFPDIGLLFLFPFASWSNP